MRLPAASRRLHQVAVPDPSLPHRPGHPVEAVVVGAGLAGFAAATVLAERGVAVRMVEAAPQVGGRLAAFSEAPVRLADGSVHTVDHGFHAFFRQYHNLRALLRRIDPELGFLRPIPDYQVEARGWPVESFGELPAGLPWNLVALCVRSPSLTLRDLRRMDGAAALPLLAYDPDTTYRDFDSTSAAALLDRVGFPDRARALLFDVFAHSFFNREAEMSAAEMIMLFHFYFLGNSTGLLFDAADEDYATCLWQPLTAQLEARGGTVVTGTPVTALEPAGAGRWSVVCGDGSRVTTRHVVLAVDVAALRRIVAASPELRAQAPVLARQAASLRTTNPYAVSRLWLGGDVAAHRCAFTAFSREQTLDSAALYHRFAREPMRWARASGGAVVELHAYAAPQDVAAQELHERMRAEWAGLWDEADSLPVLAQSYRLGADAPAFGLGSAADRPGVRTDAPGIRLAGDGVALPFPTALMERAAASGILAANDVLAAVGAAAEPVVGIRPRGLLAGTRAARLARAA